jgi:hypothetical protein
MSYWKFLQQKLFILAFMLTLCSWVKMISKDSGAVLNEKSSGVVLKDNPSAGSNGGATWAYEVAGQTMVCPIIVEDLTPPGQMLVEVWFIHE